METPGLEGDSRVRGYSRVGLGLQDVMGTPG